MVPQEAAPEPQEAAMAQTTIDRMRPVAHMEVGEHGLSVTVSWPEAGVDRPSTGGYGLGADTAASRKVGARLVAAINDGAVHFDPEILTDVNGATYVSASRRVFGRQLRADLTRIGY